MEFLKLPRGFLDFFMGFMLDLYQGLRRLKDVVVDIFLRKFSRSAYRDVGC